MTETTTRPHLLVLLEWKDHPIFISNTEQSIYWNYNGELKEFTGVAGATSVEGFENNGDMSATTITLNLGVLPDIDITSIDSKDYQGRKVYVWDVRLDENGVVIESAQKWVGYMSHINISVSERLSVISLVCSDRSVDWDRASNHLVNHERQTERYPNDNFLIHVNEMQGAVVRV